jgi:hypothetical protein
MNSTDIFRPSNPDHAPFVHLSVMPFRRICPGKLRQQRRTENFADPGSSYIYAPSLRSQAERNT